MNSIHFERGVLESVFTAHLSVPFPATGCQELFEDGLANGDERTAAEEAAALAAKEAKGGTVKFGWVKGVLVSLRLQSKLVTAGFPDQFQVWVSLL